MWAFYRLNYGLSFPATAGSLSGLNGIQAAGGEIFDFFIISIAYKGDVFM